MGVIRVPALEIRQGPNRTFYTFAIDGKLLPRFATVSRIRRDGNDLLVGYQRPEVLSHITEIRTYIESPDPLLPNAIVLAFDSRVKFIPDGDTHDYSRSGTLAIPIIESDDQNKPGLIVDGQQRCAAIRDSAVSSFPICATAFIADDDREQREQFILVNSTKPLPKGLIYELLPTTEMKLSPLLERRKLPAQILTRLNSDEGSPLKGRIKTPTTPNGFVQDNSILKMLENSLSDGALYRYRDAETGEVDLDGVLTVLRAFWTATSTVFPKAWGLPPTRSRLMHGAGIISMGFVMDAIAERRRDHGVPHADFFADDLRPLSNVCRWTDGYWEFGPGIQRKWNEVQNTPKDIQMLANYLMVQYKALVWNRPSLDGPGRMKEPTKDERNTL
ncbi:MAG: DGQHR domain-containing protein DpdB [Bryobacteraceae bacterium]